MDDSIKIRIPDVSIIIVNWNTKALLRDCLRSVYDCAGDVGFEIIVVDNASADGSPDVVEEEFPDVRLIRNAGNVGFAAANNQGMRIAEGRYLLLLNSDTRVLDGAIAKSVRFADAHPDAGIVGCRTLRETGLVQFNCYRFPSLFNLALSLTGLPRCFPRNRFFGRHRFTWWDYDTPRIVDAVAGCFMLARREAVAEVGLMAEDYFMYSEDTDWCWRFKRHGWKTMYTPDAVIEHVRAGSSSKAATNMYVIERRSLLMFLERKSGTLTRWIANAMFAAGALTRLATLGLARAFGLSKGAGSDAQWEKSTAAARFHVLGRLPAGCKTTFDAVVPAAESNGGIRRDRRLETASPHAAAHEHCNAKSY